MTQIDTENYQTDSELISTMTYVRDTTLVEYYNSLITRLDIEIDRLKEQRKNYIRQKEKCQRRIEDYYKQRIAFLSKGEELL